MPEAKPTGSQILAMTKKRRRRALIQRILIALVVLGGVGAVVYQRTVGGKSAAPRYVTAQAKLGPLRETVMATGKFKGLDSVDVGAQISGRVARVLVDFNDQVKAGQTLAEIDPAQLLSRVEQSRAQVSASDSSVRLAKATLAQAKAALARAKDMADKGLISSKDLEAAQADAERAEASVGSSQSQAILSRASLKDAETSLSWTTIKAPIDGVVLARLVEPGQTVAASLQSPVLFTVARDLSQLTLYVDIDEADIGRLREGQEASFTVGAWPSRKFASKVISVRNLPTAGQTVVTYQAVLSVDNKDLLLRPGMTATASIITSDRPDVLTVPDAALRWQPPAPPKDKPSSSPFMPMTPPRMGQRRPGANARSPDAAANASRGTLYVLENGAPKRVVVETGGGDGQNTEIKPGPIQAGTVVITDLEQTKAP
ncbi:MAG: efflux RND transporter periplasmic adaptor subunit [Myxococcales bacterium]|nr:MAG: efflux RND transporter periplasmic adaptor subunit [Myxococcales bacterium]